MVDSNPLWAAANNYMDISYFNLPYFFDVVIVTFFFIVGYCSIRRLKYTKHSVLDALSGYTLSSFFLFTLFFVLVIFLIISAHLKGISFFSGYAVYDIAVLGPFATSSFLSVWFINYFSSNKVKFLFFMIFSVSSCILLGLGSRMFFVLPFMTFLLGLLSRRKYLLKSFKLYFVLFLFFVFVVGIGVWRGGGSELSIETAIGVLFAEPLFTATSGALYLENAGGRSILNIPYGVAAAFINFIPSVIYPDKTQLINSIIQNTYIYSPLGANALIANLYSNFGVLYPLYIMMIGSLYGYLNKKAMNSSFHLAVYFSLLPLLMFYFFREGLITVIKVMFFNGLILPFFIISFLLAIFRKNQIID
jgi:hypothetical protein